MKNCGKNNSNFYRRIKEILAFLGCKAIDWQIEGGGRACKRDILLLFQS